MTKRESWPGGYSMKWSLHILSLLCCTMVCESATAQLFGPRAIGRNARGNQMTDTSTAGTVTDDRRFVRGSRSADNFVGADRTEASVFVGNAQATNDGAVTTAVESLREQPTARVNRTATTIRRGMYRPRLSIGFSTQPESQQVADSRGQTTFLRLSQPIRELSVDRGFQVSHVPTERGAILTGTVRTEHDRQIAELLVMFEPGVETVTNRLEVQNSRP